MKGVNHLKCSFIICIITTIFSTMPKWKSIPTLRTLALRNVAWPDAVLKPETAKQHCPSLEAYVRHTLIDPYFSEEKRKVVEKRKHNIAAQKDPIRKITEDVLNAWIRLSNFYETRLSEFDSMAMFMRMSTVGTLDFLHEGFTLRDEKNFTSEILPYIGVVPFTLRPQKIDFRTWYDLVNVMVTEDVCESLEHLYIPFGNERLNEYNIPPDIDIKSPIVFRFEKTIECFINLKTLVVRGDIVRDNFMLAVGESCCFLEHLDVRGTRVTDRGVVLLLFQKVGKRFFKGAYLPSLCRFPAYPPEILRPCCATLKYLDVSDIRSHHQSSLCYDMYITRACPALRATPLKFYFQVPGKSKVVLKDLIDRHSVLTGFRMNLIRYVRQNFCENLYEFTKILFETIHFENPSFEVMENEKGMESAFLFLSGSAVLFHCELENLVIVTLVSYARNVLHYIPIHAIAKLAPNLQKLKACLRGKLTAEIQMKHLKYLSSPSVRYIHTIEGILEHCPSLQYLEIKDVLMVNTRTQFGDALTEQIFHKDPGAYKCLEVLRFLFPNQIGLIGLSWIAVRCPVLRIVGDMALWGISIDTAMRVFTNTGFYNYDFVLEYNGVLHFCDRHNNKMDLERFE